jgi:16S rRNA processing protein RimM
VRGEVRVKSFTAEPTTLGAYGPLATKDGRSLAVERLRPIKDDMVAVKFRGIDDRDAAERLKNLMVGVARDALPAPEAGEFYHADLIGLQAVGQDGALLGTVVAVENFGAGDLIEIAPEDGPSRLVPFTRAAVPDIDVAGGRLVVVPPEEITIPEEDEP